MLEYRVEVKPWMLKKATESFNFMKQFNADVPMPLMVMYTGGKLDETGTRIKCILHGDIKQRVTTTCMACGRPITNKISQYFGIGPVCGGHNYVNPFGSKEELDAAVSKYRTKLVNTVWKGWIPLSGIKSIDGETNPVLIKKIIDNMPIEILADDLGYGKTDFINDAVPAFPVTVRIDAPKKCTGDFSAYLTSRYNNVLLDRIKEITTISRAYDPESKIWEIDYLEFKKLREELESNPKYSFDFQVTGESIVPSVPNYNYEFKTEPMNYQIDGVQYGLEHSRFLLGDQQGCGKTKEVIDLACIRKQTFGFRHCLIICGINGLKWNWLEEIEKHSNEKAYILGQYFMPRRKKLSVKGNAEKLADLERLTDPNEDLPYFLITNIESVRNAVIADKIKDLCAAKIIDMVAIDEAHRIRNLNTRTGEGILKIQPYYRVAMTGTPLINNPLDLYALLKWLGYQPYEFKQFKYHFCQYDEWGNIVGYKNIDQLKGQLQSIMLRRTKEEVLVDLPDKVYVNEYVELTDEQKQIYNDVIDGVINDESLETAQDCELVLRLRLRQISGGIGPFKYLKKVPKLDRLEELVEEAVYSGTKTIIYSNWIEGLEPAVERLSKYNPVVITGETKDADRQAIVNRFQTDPEVKVILGTIGALGTGVTLTAGTEVLFIDEPWTNAIKEQAVDRAHRIGTKSTVTVRTLMSYGTYDEEVHAIVLGKKQISDRVVDRKEFKNWKVA